MYLIIIVYIFNSNTNYLLSRVVRISGNSDSIELNLLIQREIILDLNILVRNINKYRIIYSQIHKSHKTHINSKVGNILRYQITEIS